MTQLIVNQGSHDDRKAILSCILRLLQTCWNIGNFNAVAEIINGLKSVTRCVAFIFVETAGRKQRDYCDSHISGLIPVSVP